MPEGRFIGDRHKFMWIDTLHDAVNADLDMSEDGLNELRYYEQVMEGMYKI